MEGGRKEEKKAGRKEGVGKEAGRQGGRQAGREEGGKLLSVARSLRKRLSSRWLRGVYIVLGHSIHYVDVCWLL